MPIGKLDYPAERLAPFGREKILMEANTDLEVAFRLKACAKEPWTVVMIEELQPGEVLYDVGANVGSYTLLAAARGVQVVAFEPHFASFAALVRNLALNDLLSRVIPLQVALLSGPGLLWLHLNDLRAGTAGHAMSSDPKKQGFHKQAVPIFPLDSLQAQLGLPLPTAIKIDVDGAEGDVLAGAENLLAQPSLRVLMVELRLDVEQAGCAWLAERGWLMTARFDERGGKKIGNICYGRFHRVASLETAG
mgnify:CR=1 FL=1